MIPESADVSHALIAEVSDFTRWGMNVPVPDFGTVDVAALAIAILAAKCRAMHGWIVTLAANFEATDFARGSDWLTL